MSALLLLLEAYVRLLLHDLFMRGHSFVALYQRVKQFPCAPTSTADSSPEAVCHALDLACALYGKQVLCLQRSAVLLQMLRQRGLPAQMMIGAQKMPFKAHAWVEVHGQVVNDRLASRENFLVLEVC
jgi:hypothetical protein